MNKKTQVTVTLNYLAKKKTYLDLVRNVTSKYEFHVAPMIRQYYFQRLRTDHHISGAIKITHSKKELMNFSDELFHPSDATT